MFAWTSKLLATTWNRRTRWTKLLLTQRELQRALAKERSRVDRDGDSCFGFLILRLCKLTGARRQTIQLARLLHRRLRDTDEKGHLGLGRIGVMLPSTAPSGCEFVLEDILSLCQRAGLEVEGESFVYPDRGDDSTPAGGQSEQQVHSLPANVQLMRAVDAEKRVSAAALQHMLPRYPAWKRTVDVSFSLVGLFVAMPVLFLAILAIKMTSPGPIIFRQRRTGYRGEPFNIFKLRTMVCNASDLQAELMERNERDGPAFKMKNDPRITQVGRLLRSTGIDELPQLFNVLRGDMSLVGPRPLPVDEAAQCNSWQHRRHEVKPGVTCFWQIAKSRKILFVDWMRLDLHYVRNASPVLDIRLIAKTFKSVLLGRVGH